jgi:hypothetical protein
MKPVNNKKNTIPFKRAINRKINSHNERVKVCFITSNQWFRNFPTECITFQLRFNSLYSSSSVNSIYFRTTYVALQPREPNCSVINQLHWRLGHVYHCAMYQFHTMSLIGYCVKPQTNAAFILLPFKKIAFFSDTDLTQFHKNSVFKTRKTSSSVNSVSIHAQCENRSKS